MRPSTGILSTPSERRHRKLCSWTIARSMSKARARWEFTPFDSNLLDSLRRIWRRWVFRFCRSMQNRPPRSQLAALQHNELEARRRQRVRNFDLLARSCRVFDLTEILLLRQAIPLDRERVLLSPRKIIDRKFVALIVLVMDVRSGGQKRQLGKIRQHAFGSRTCRRLHGRS